MAKKSYIFKTTRRVPNQVFVARPDGKDPIRYKFPESGLLKGDGKDKKNLQCHIDRGLLVCMEGAVLEEFLDEGEKTPDDIRKLLVIEAKDLKIKEFAGKPIAECTTSELEVAIADQSGKV